MIHDGLWQNDLQSLSKDILSWQKQANSLIQQKCLYCDDRMVTTRHQLLKSIFYSASVVRKVVEEELEYHSFLKKHKHDLGLEFYQDKYHIVHSYQVNTIQYPIKEGSLNCFEDYCVDDFNLESSRSVPCSIKSVSNWIIHSYVWLLGSFDESKSITGFFVSSDFDKANYLSYIDLGEWIKAIDYCAKEAYI